MTSRQQACGSVQARRQRCAPSFFLRLAARCDLARRPPRDCYLVVGIQPPAQSGPPLSSLPRAYGQLRTTPLARGFRRRLSSRARQPRLTPERWPPRASPSPSLIRNVGSRLVERAQVEACSAVCLVRARLLRSSSARPSESRLARSQRCW